MSKGTRTTDLRYTDADGAAKSLGKLFSKSWSGGDNGPLAKERKLVKAAFPGFWHDYKSVHANYFSSALVWQVSKRDGKRRVTDSSLAELKRRHREVYEKYQAEMARFLKLKKDYIDRKQRTATFLSNQNAYNCTIVQSNDVPCSWRQKLSTWGPWHNNVSASAVFGNQVGPGSCWDSNDDNALIEKLRSKLNGVPGFHAGVALAELDKTIKMFGDVAKCLVSFGKWMKWGNVPEALRVLYNGGDRRDSTIGGRDWDALPRAAKIYLGYQFGLKPLLEDVKSGAQMLGWQAGFTKTCRIRVRRRRSADKHTSSTQAVQHGWRTEETGQIVAYLTQAPKAVDFSGLTDLASILWERQWMSFVVDWWIPVGGALSAMHVSQILKGTFVTTRVTRQTRTAYSSGNGSYGTYQVLGDSSYYRTIIVKRTISQTLIPKLPKLKPVFHPNREVRLRHTLEAGSLLIVQRKNIIKSAKWLQSAFRA